MKKYCLDCHKEISQEAQRCSHCAKLGDLNHHYINGSSIKKSYCIDCEKELSKFKYKRCSSCIMKYKHKNNLIKHLKGKDNPNFGKTGKTAINYKHGKFVESNWKCIKCGEKISKGSFAFGKQRCSKCYHKYIKEFGIIKGKNNPMYGMTGEKHPNYIDGRSYLPYTSEFTLELKESIRKRDNYTCQNCNMTEEEHLIVVGRVLHVHHIDYNKQNCDGNNLISLCIHCNVRANYNRDYWQEIYTKKINDLLKEINQIR